MAFSAVDWLNSVSEAVKSINNDEAIEQRRRELALGRGATLHDIVVSSSPDFDVMRSVDALADFAESRERRLSVARAEVADAMRVFEGMRSVGHMEAAAADVLELTYIHLLSRGEVAAELGMSRSSAQRCHAYGVEWLDANGLAHAKVGMGAAAV